MRKSALLIMLFFLTGCAAQNKIAQEKNLLGIEYYTNKEYEKALEAFSEAFTEESNPEYLLNQGMVLIAIEEYIQALDVFDQAIELKDGKLEQLYYGKGVASSYRGEYEEALKYFEQSLLENKNNHKLDTLLYMASTKRKLKLYEEALRLYDLALKEFPKEQHKIWLERGLLLNELGQFEEAVRSFDKIIENDEVGIVYNHRGVSYLYMGELEKGKKDIEKALEMIGESSEILLNYGLYYEKIKEYDKAIDYYSRVIEDEKSRGKGYLSRGLVQYQLGRTEEAIEDLTLALSHKRKEASLYLGQIYFELGQIHKGLELYEFYLIQDKNPMVMNQLGLHYIEIKEYSKALVHFMNAIEVLPNEKTLLFNTAVTYEFLGHYEAARVFIEKVLEVDPEDKEAIKELEFINSRITN